MKGGQWELYNAPITTSWVIKKLCKVKENLRDQMNIPSYSTKLVWNRATTPKSRFVVWLSCHDRLKTKQQLMNIGVTDNDECSICGSQPKTVDHPFFKCEFSIRCVEGLKSQLGVKWSIQNLKDLYRKRRIAKAKMRIIEAVFCNLMYSIWHVRNEAVWKNKVMSINHIVESVKIESKIRFSSIHMKFASDWVRIL